MRRGFGMESDTEDMPSLAQLPDFVQQLQARLLHDCSKSPASDGERNQRERLLALLPGAYEQADSLVRDLRAIAAQSRALGGGDGFRLSAGAAPQASLGRLPPEHQERSNWLAMTCSRRRRALRLSSQSPKVMCLKTHGPDWDESMLPVRGGPPTLISWAGTMFEYLMPAIWMRSQYDTLLQQSMQGAVRAQKAYAAARQSPLGNF